MANNFFRKLFSLVNIASLVFQLVAPVVTLAPTPAYAANISTSVSFDSGSNNFNFTVTSDKTVDYLLAYRTDKNTTQGAQGSGQADKGQDFSRTIYAGTNSSGTPVPNNVLRSILKTKVTQGNYLHSIWATINGSLTVVHEENAISLDLSSDETTFLETGALPQNNSPPVSTPSSSLTNQPTVSSTPSSTATVAGAQSQPEGKHGSLSAAILKNASANSLQLDLSSPTTAGSATLTTNKPDYSPTDTVIITGSGFDANKTLTLEITSANPPPVDFTTSITTNSTGGFVYAYQLDGNYRPNYTIYVKDGSTVVASTTFTDTASATPAIDVYSQCANGTGSGPTCSWTNGDLNNSNSKYYEGDATPQRLAIEDLATGDYTVTVQYDTSKGGKHAYDFLADDKFSENWITNADMCSSPITHMAGCSGLAAADSGLIPADPNASGHDTATSSRHFRIRNGTWVGSGVLSGPTLVSGSYAGDSSTNIQLKFHVDTSTCANKYQVKVQGQDTDVCEVLITFGAHVSSQLDWGVGTSAVNISGSPYHVRIVDLNGSSVGSRDNQMAANAIIPPSTITIHKTTVPAGGTGFGFTTTGSLSPSTFSLDDGTSQSYINLVPGSYSVTENDPSSKGYSLTGLTCTASGTGTSATTNTGTRTVSIIIGTAGSGVVDCTYTNTKSKVTPTISTTPSAGGNIGTVLNDSATLGSGFNPTGSITFKLFSPSDTSNCQTGAVYTQTVSVSGNSTYSTTPGFASNTSGTYHWTASYSGDSFNNSVASGCADETVAIGKLTPTLTTTASGPVIIGANITDTAHLSGGFGPLAGTITFDVFAPGDTTCATPISVSPSKTVSGAGDYTSGNYATSAVGTYRWIAHYSGDSNNNAVNTACNDANESSTVNKTNPTIATTLSATSVAIGTAVHDSATLTGVTGNAGGTVVYTVYTDNLCSTGAQGAGTKTVTSGVIPDSDPITFNNAGDFYWQAVYSGDASNNGATSNCLSEHLVTNKNSPTIATTLADTTITVGGSTHDTSALSGATANAGGSVTYTAYSDNICTQNAQSAGTVTVTNGSVPNSNNITFNAPGDFYWQAVYSGDTNNNGATSTCASEHLVVNQATPSISTTPNPASGNVGATLNDSATLTNGVNPTGNILFKLYSPSDPNCSGDPTFTNSVSVSGNNAYGTSAGFTSNAAGTWHWSALYSGDINNASTSSLCSEAVTVNKLSPTISTALSSISSVVGSQVHDSATLTGATGDARGTVTYTVYTDTSCSQNAQSAGTKTVTNGVVPNSNDITFNNVGDYYWQAVYSGDTNNNGATSTCTSEHLVINKIDTTATTSAHNPSHQDITNSSIALGTAVHDSATVTPATNGPTIGGTVTYSLYSNADCDSALVVPAETVAVGTESTPQTLGAGTYGYKASYSGDANYNGSTGNCESFTINQGTSEVATTLHKADESTVIVGSSVPLGTVMHDLATVSVSGSFAPSGNVDFTFYTSGDCSGKGASMGSITLNGANPGVAHPSDSTTALAVGSYSFQASWAGDNNYTGNTSSCENFSISKSNTTTTTQVHNVDHKDITNTSIALGSVVHDSATVGTQVGDFVITGDVTYHFYTTGNCSGNLTDKTVAVGSESSETNALGAGSYSYKADYAGDDNYNGSTGACEPFNVNQGTPTVTTVIHDADHNPVGPELLVNTVHDSAEVSGIEGFAPTGSVDFTFYTNDICRGEGTSSGAGVALSSGIADPSNSQGPLNAGHYAFKAHYNGDTNFAAANSGCEPFSVTTLKVIKNVSGGTASASDFNLHVTDENGDDVNGSPQSGSTTGTLYQLNSGDYTVSEDPMGGYTESFSADCLEGSVSLAAGDAKTCTVTNTRDTGTVVVHKQTDADGNGSYETGDAGSNTLGFRWSLDGGSTDRLMGSDAVITTGDKHNVTENSVSGFVFTGWYESNSEDFSCLRPESTTLPISGFTVTKGSTRSFTLCNQLQNPILTISKSNNAGGDKAPGDNVLFTLTVTATQSAAFNVKVTDLPAGGFIYHSGSWTATRNGVPFAVTEPVYASPGVWQIGNMAKDDVVVLTYKADIDGAIRPGLYKDLAWAAGCKTSTSCSVSDSNSVLASSINPGVVTDNFVGTQVNVVREELTSTSIEGQVLGASTSLPSTGGRTIWVILATLLVLVGSALMALGFKKKMFVVILVLFAGLTLFAQKPVLAFDSLSVRIEQPKSPTKDNNFDINFVALDILGRSVTAQCFKKGPSDGSFSQFGSNINLAAGGNSGYCHVDSSIVNSNNSTYQFYVKALAGADTATSATDSVDYNTSGPGTPSNYSKDRLNPCQYKINFKTADDGGKTVKVEIYRSTSTSFTLDNSTRVGSVSIGSNTTGSFTDTVPDCGATYYYEIRAFDSAGNGSGVVGDDVNVTTTTTTTTPPAGGGAIPVSGGNIPAVPSVLSEQKAATGESGVLGEASPSPEVKELPSPAGQSSNRLWLLGLLALLVLLCGYVLYRRRQEQV